MSLGPTLLVETQIIVWTTDLTIWYLSIRRKHLYKRKPVGCPKRFDCSVESVLTFEGSGSILVKIRNALTWFEHIWLDAATILKLSRLGINQMSLMCGKFCHEVDKYTWCYEYPKWESPELTKRWPWKRTASADLKEMWWFGWMCMW